MEAVYFFAGISLLVAGNYFLVYRINKKSYLHSPISLRRANRNRNQIVQPEPEPEQTLGQKKMHDYVDWYTQRNPATRKQEEPVDEENAHMPSCRREQEVLVGIALVEKPTRTDRLPRGHSNIDRWYRSAVNA